MKLFWKIMRFLVYLYYTQPFYRTSTFGQNHVNVNSKFLVVAKRTKHKLALTSECYLSTISVESRIVVMKYIAAVQKSKRHRVHMQEQ